LSSGCRADPILILADGTQLRLTATIESEAPHIRQITYAIHLPRGSVVSRVVLTGGPLTGKEVVAVTADQAARVFTTETEVVMHDPVRCGTAVRAASSVAIQGGAASAAVSHTACTALPITLRP
jgi:hypothetical protein